MARRTLLSDAEIAARFGEIPKWTRVGQILERTWTFKDFPEALAFINRVGKLAEAANHHPDIHNSWNRVTLRLTTHDRGGLTNLDFDLATKIDGLHAKPRT
jgi:4a-hydroxytetrahydrobiopterin dehydratase